MSPSFTTEFQSLPRVSFYAESMINLYPAIIIKLEEDKDVSMIND
jgi:hypothetical protein